MAFDGITICNLVSEFKNELINGRINKIAQPEKDALMLTLKGNQGSRRLFISASASLPLIFFTSKNKTNPLVAPNFCMLLRKYISTGRITNIYQPEFERIIIFEIEHLNELGDPCKKKLIVEIMGKHSNIIFCDEDGTIIDSIKHISASMSSVREVLPGRTYFIPKTQEKANPLSTTKEEFYQLVYSKPCNVVKAIYTSYSGISPVAASELCFRSSIEGDRPVEALSDVEKTHLFHTFELFMEDIHAERFQPTIVYDGEEPKDYTCMSYEQFRDYKNKALQSISETLENFYADKETYSRRRQKSADLRRIVSTCLERNSKKYDLQFQQIKDTDNMEKFKVYGELLHTYGYNLEPGAKELRCINFYTNEEVVIPLDDTKSAAENAKRYFDKYGKQKRTREALNELIVETQNEITHLDTILTSIDLAESEDDLAQIKEELIENGYVKRTTINKKSKIKSKPLHYRSSKGFDIYVGKNNLQNEEITFKLANGGDWWFHAKKIPGSHVIVKTNGQELPDVVFEEAAKLAAFYSKGRGSDKVEIDYVKRKEVKKPNGSKPGFVVYYTNYSMNSDTNIKEIELIED